MMGFTRGSPHFEHRKHRWNGPWPIIRPSPPPLVVVVPYRLGTAAGLVFTPIRNRPDRCC